MNKSSLVSSESNGGQHLTRKSLATVYSVSLRTVDSWLARGWVPFLRLGGAIRFNADDVDRALRERFEIKARPTRK